MYSINFNYLSKPLTHHSDDYKHELDRAGLQAKYYKKVKDGFDLDINNKKARKLRKHFIAENPNSELGEFKFVNTAYGWTTQYNNDIKYLISKLTEGYSYCSELTGGHREGDNFISNSFLFVDLDNAEQTIAKSLEHPFFNEYGSAYYATASYTPEIQKHRLIYKLESDVTDKEEMHALYAAIIAIHNSDPAAKDAARMFFGAKTDIFDTFDNVLPTDVMLKMIEDGEELLEAEKLKSKSKSKQSGNSKIKFKGGKQVLPADTVFNYAGGSILFGDVTERIQDVLCPNHDDKTGSEFLNVSRYDNIMFCCSACGTIYVDKPNHYDSIPALSLDEQRAKIAEYVADDSHTHKIIISNPGVGKSMGIPNAVAGKVLYARSSNVAARELHDSLADHYPNKNIYLKISIVEQIKERFPDLIIDVNDSTDDVFAAPAAAWESTFAKLSKEDRLIAETMRKQYHDNGEDSQEFLNTYDIIVCTTFTLKRLWEPVKWWSSYDFPVSKPSKKFKQNVKRSPRLMSLVNHLMNHDNCEEHEFIYKRALSNEFTVVIDDPTGADGSMVQQYKDGDMTLVKNAAIAESKLDHLKQYPHLHEHFLPDSAGVEYGGKEAGLFNAKFLGSLKRDLNLVHYHIKPN